PRPLRAACQAAPAQPQPAAVERTPVESPSPLGGKTLGLSQCHSTDTIFPTSSQVKGRRSIITYDLAKRRRVHVGQLAVRVVDEVSVLFVPPPLDDGRVVGGNNLGHFSPRAVEGFDEDLFGPG